MSSPLPNADHALPASVCAWHIAWTSGRALWISECMKKPAAFAGRLYRHIRIIFTTR